MCISISASISSEGGCIRKVGERCDKWAWNLDMGVGVSQSAGRVRETDRPYGCRMSGKDRVSKCGFTDSSSSPTPPPPISTGGAMFSPFWAQYRLIFRFSRSCF